MICMRCMDKVKTHVPHLASKQHGECETSLLTSRRDFLRGTRLESKFQDRRPDASDCRRHQALRYSGVIGVALELPRILKLHRVDKRIKSKGQIEGSGWLVS
jgi:hypothetical protein